MKRKLRVITNVTTNSEASMGEVLSYDVMGNIATMNGDGNMTTDGKTGAAITYNLLNLPASFTKSSTHLNQLL